MKIKSIILIFSCILVDILYITFNYNEFSALKNNKCSFGYSTLEDKSYLLKANELLSKKGVVLLYFDENDNKYKKVEDESQIKYSLFETLNFIRTERKEKTSSKEAVNRVFGILGDEKNNYIILSEELKNKIYKNPKKYLKIDDTCTLINELLEFEL